MTTTPRYVLRKRARPLPRARLATRRRTGARVLPRQAQCRHGLSAGAAGGAIGPGRSAGRQSYGIDALNEYDPLVDDIYDFCEAQEIELGTLSHEAGVAQLEINLSHGDPLELADQAFLFKRTVREAATRHGVFATFMAKPMESEPGSAMHIHQSVVDAGTGENVFADAETAR